MPGRELARLHADHLPVGCPRKRVVGLGLKQLRAAGGKPGLRLRNVGPRHLAHGKAVAGLLELLLEDEHVALLQLEDRRVPQQVHVGGHGIEQHPLLGQAQRLARAENLRFRLPGPVAGLEAVEDGLVRRHAIGLDEVLADGSRIDRRPDALRFCQGIDMLLGEVPLAVTRGR